MKIYTKSGDQGETSLFGGQRVSKTHARIDAYGTIDELNSALGIVRTCTMAQTLEPLLKRLQNELFVLGSDLATPLEKNSRIHRITQAHVDQLEQDIDHLEASLKPLKTFILPGGSQESAYLHLARTICRRAERIVISCNKSEKISAESLIYLNRLSDLLFVMARYQNHTRNIDDVPWKSP